MFDSTVLLGLAIFVVVCAVAAVIVLRRPKAVFDSRQSVQHAVEAHFLRLGDKRNQVAWCAPGENGFYGVFELRDGRFGVAKGRMFSPSVNSLASGDIKQIIQSKDGFTLTVIFTAWLTPKIKLVFDDVATATYARDLLAKAKFSA